MKKILFSILMLIAIALTACTSQSTGTPTESTSNDPPIANQLAVGTLKLEGTEQAITVAQAEELVVYWQVYQEISQSETAAQAEIDGLMAQIQETMTTEQMQAITDMQITQQDIFTSMQGVAAVSNSSDDTTVSLPSSGSMPSGGPPTDGGGAPPDGGGEMPADMSGAAPASATEQSQSSQAAAVVPSALVAAVIQSLQQIIAA